MRLFRRVVCDVCSQVTANSLCGQVGARTSPIYLKEQAASTTATGRNMILKAKKFIEEEFHGGYCVKENGMVRP